MRIGLCGTMSVGKSSLVKALSQQPEFKNYYIATERSKYLRDLGIPLNTDSTLKGQIIFAAERSSELFHDNLLTDRTILDVMAFTSLAKSINTFEKIQFENCMSSLIKEYDIIFYISPEGMPIENNNIRETNPEYRLKVDESIKSFLIQYPPKKLVNIVGGDINNRIKKILENIKN